MDVFISWSGDRSQRVAELLKRWIPLVIQSIKPIISTDIPRGAQWAKEINNSLNDIKSGIFCITKENINAPWIMFEAGAICKGDESSNVCTFLIDLEKKDLSSGPLLQFNATDHSKSDILKLISTLNAKLGEHQLDNDKLNQTFEAFWPMFESKFEQIIRETKSSQTETSPEEIWRDILANTKDMLVLNQKNWDSYWKSCDDSNYASGVMNENRTYLKGKKNDLYNTQN